MQKEIVLKIQENNYVIKPITAGNIIDIESAKVLYSNNTYTQLLSSNTYSNKLAQEITECFAVLDNITPKEFKKDLNVETLFELDLENTLLLIKAYKEQIAPYYNGLIALYKEAFKESEEKA
jgi:hypothetical protein